MPVRPSAVDEGEDADLRERRDVEVRAAVGGAGDAQHDGAVALRNEADHDEGIGDDQRSERAMMENSGWLVRRSVKADV